MEPGNGHHMMDSPRKKVKEQHMMVASPGTPRRHTKLKISGATQTAQAHAPMLIGSALIGSHSAISASHWLL